MVFHKNKNGVSCWILFLAAVKNQETSRTVFSPNRPIATNYEIVKDPVYQLLMSWVFWCKISYGAMVYEQRISWYTHIYTYVYKQVKRLATRLKTRKRQNSPFYFTFLHIFTFFHTFESWDNRFASLRQKKKNSHDDKQLLLYDEPIVAHIFSLHRGIL